jgi:hypothetical protein
MNRRAFFLFLLVRGGAGYMQAQAQATAAPPPLPPVLVTISEMTEAAGALPRGVLWGSPDCDATEHNRSAEAAVSSPESVAKRARTGESSELSDALVTALDEGDFEGLCESRQRSLVCPFFLPAFFWQASWR